MVAIDSEEDKEIRDILAPIVATRLVFILGIVNLITGALVLFSCRCLPTSKIGSKLMQHAAYKRFYKYHCYIWWAFWTSVIVHAVLVIVFLGIPF